jgi:cytochrome b6-f complex iron-sulfur subunit
MERQSPVESPEQTRRSFCLHACQAVSLLTLGTLLEGCGGGGGSPTSPTAAPALPLINAGVSNNVATITVDSASPLSTVGGAALLQTPAGNFLVSRTATTSFVAVTAVCTHEACTVTGFASSVYVCPCHGSQYTTGGTVVRGPATRALRQFSTQFSDNVLTVSVV